MQHIIQGLRRKNKKEEEDFYYENVEKLPLCKRYMNVHYVVLCRIVDVIL